MKLSERVRTALRSFLQLQPAKDYPVTITEDVSHGGNVIKNLIWYRGEASELHQLYGQLDSGYTGRSRFWAAAPAQQQIRKIHSGLPALITDTIVRIITADLDDVDFGNDPNAPGRAAWEKMRDEIDLNKLCAEAVRGVLITGDGAFKFSVDSVLSRFPLVEWFSADRVEYEYARGKITQINFFTDYVHERRRYRLREEYRKGHVGYTLFFGEREVDIGEVPQLAGLAPVDFDGDFLMAVPVQFYESPKYQGRGRSIYDVKEDAFDAFDEVISQWMDALRAGRVRVYVPSTMIPRDPKTGGTLPFEQFGAYYAATERPLQEGIRDEIDTVQPKIAFEAFLRTYMTTLDLCLQGLISPATLGIDVGKMSSADAQREKKDVTGTTRNQITAMLEKALADLVCTALQVFDITQGRAPGVYSPVVGFGEYGAPSFETRIDAVSKAAAAEIMSVEAQVTELWGGSKDKDWIAAEVERIKRERGVETVPGPPGVGDPL